MTDRQAWTLQDLARAALDANPGVSGRELERRARKHGLTITHTTFNAIAAGSYTWKPSKATLEALAWLAGVDAQDAYLAAGQPMPLTSLAEQLPPDADLLTGPQREAVIAVVRQFAAVNKALHETQNGGGGDAGAAARGPAPMKPTPVPDVEPFDEDPDLPPDDDLDDVELEGPSDPVYGEQLEQRAAREKKPKKQHRPMGSGDEL